MKASEGMRGLCRLLCVCGILVSAAFAEGDKVLKVCADAWMPFNGEPDSKKPGYVVEMLKEIFEPQGIKVEYTLQPYKEALAAAREGKIDAVIGPDESEAKDLTFPKQPIGKPSVLLLTNAKVDFQYDSIRSLKKGKLGVIEGYTYWDALDAYIGKDQNVVVAKGDDPLQELFSKLDSGEVTVLAEMETVVLWYMREHKLQRTDFKAVYRHSPNAIYVAFGGTDRGREFGAIFDKGVATLRSSGRLGKLLASYGLTDWDE